MTELESLQQYIESETSRWAEQYIDQRKSFLRSRKIEATGELINTLEADINRQARKEVIELLMAFPDYGRIIDMRRFSPPRGGGDYLTAIERWIESKGLRDKMVQGYLKRHKLRKTPNNILNRIAWGIVIKRNIGRYRRRRWYNKSISGAITDLYNQVAGNMPEIIAQQITAKFKKN